MMQCSEEGPWPLNTRSLWEITNGPLKETLLVLKAKPRGWTGGPCFLHISVEIREPAKWLRQGRERQGTGSCYMNWTGKWSCMHECRWSLWQQGKITEWNNVLEQVRERTEKLQLIPLTLQAMHKEQLNVSACRTFAGSWCVVTIFRNLFWVWRALLTISAC